EFAKNEYFTKIQRELFNRLAHQSASVVLEHNLFWIENARVGRAIAFVRFRGPLQWSIYMQPGIASITDNFHEPGTCITAAEAGVKTEGTQVCFLDSVLCVLLIAR